MKKRFLIFIISLILGMIFLQIFYKKTGKTPISQSAYVLFSEIQTISVNFHNSISNLVKKYVFLLNLNEKNKQLVLENNKIKTQYQLFEEMLKENERLKSLLHFPLNTKLELLPAQVIGTDILSKNELLTINKGSRQGVKKFMGVLHPEGVVGYIFRVGLNSSQVISLLSPLSSLPARNSNSRWAGLIEAHNTKLLIFNYLSQENLDKNGEYLKTGDKIVTIKSDQFPSGFPVGRILSLKQAPKELNPTVYVQPFVKFHSLEEVLIIVNFEKNPIKKYRTQKEQSLPTGIEKQNNESSN